MESSATWRAPERRKAFSIGVLQVELVHARREDFEDAGVPGDRCRVELVAALHELIDHEDDQIPLIDLGPVDGRASACISSMGRAYANPDRTVAIR